ncbi:hypothetical protein [Rhodoplanes elegans]|nr:hypothetical protein [Rhodoplanes elegans]
MPEPLAAIAVLAAIVSALAGFAAGRASAALPQHCGVTILRRNAP